MSARLPGADAPLGAGERVVLRDRKDRRYLVTLQPGGEWHSHAGVIRHDDLIGQPEGRALRTSRGMEVVALRPTLEDVTLKMPRGAQVVYRKDQAMIVALGDVRPGCTVVEAGAGSGALSLALLSAVGHEGRVVSYERRADHLAYARRNVTDVLGGMPDNWELHEGDLGDALPGLACDRLVLDVLEPWEPVKAGADALRPGGVLVAYTPTVTQVMRLVDTLQADGRYGLVQTTETLVRGWTVEGLVVRPDHRMVAHTGFLTVARRVVPSP
ncbi:MAG TPA: tRNA (adenine-N1)-methyltransferase [Nitriliruptorales bacterium]|nr:tRNA (adenine-N1)-methyltransferase [Nitriliruptorales bacterium]